MSAGGGPAVVPDLPGAPAGVFVHPRGLCESDQVGTGTRVWAFAHVLPGARIGADCNICDGAFVEGRVVLGDRVTVKNATLLFDGVTCGDDVFLGPNVLFTNDLRPRAAIRRGPDELLRTSVGSGATLGAGTVVVCGIAIGAHAFCAAGSVVTRDVPTHALVAGNPARQKGWVCRCGSRLDRLTCEACGTVHDMDPDGPGLRALDGRGAFFRVSSAIPYGLTRQGTDAPWAAERSGALDAPGREGIAQTNPEMSPSGATRRREGTVGQDPTGAATTAARTRRR